MPGRGRFWTEGGLPDSTVTSADIKDATIAAADINIYVSDLQTANGSAQAHAHGLGVVPSKVLVSIYTDNGGTATVITENNHTASNVSVTITSGAKYKILAIA